MGIPFEAAIPLVHTIPWLGLAGLGYYSREDGKGKPYFRDCLSLPLLAYALGEQA